MKKGLILTILILYACLMLFGAVWPNLGGIQALKDTIKFWHFFGFAVFGILVLKTLEIYKYKRGYLLAGLISIVFIYFTEWIQLLSPTRHFMYTDMLIDLGGVALGFILYWLVFSKIRV